MVPCSLGPYPTYSSRNPSTPGVKLTGHSEISSDEDDELAQITDKTPSIGMSSYVDSNHETGILTEASIRDNIGMEDIFDVLPLYGQIQPGQNIITKFSFFGHPFVKANCRAVCDVDGGPQYETTINGNASVIKYEFSQTTLYMDKTPFDRLAEQDIVLYNTGNVEFEFVTDLIVLQTTDNISPGEICVWPKTGKVPANSSVTLKMSYLPGFPEKFCANFFITVAHFQPTRFLVVGEGVFPRISLNLPYSKVGQDFYEVVEMVRNQMHEDGNIVNDSRLGWEMRMTASWIFLFLYI